MAAPDIRIVGGGLAGCEAALQLAQRGHAVTLYEMRPTVPTPAHQTGRLAEIVCSNSLKSNDPATGSGMLKEELDRLQCQLLDIARAHQVPAGAALAIDRDRFAAAVEARLEQEPLITIRREEVGRLEIAPDRWWLVATGPLTSAALQDQLAGLTGRGGLQPENVVAVAAAAHADPRFELAGLWSHLHSPEDPPTSDGQLLRFDIATTALREARVPVPPRHAAASGGIFTGDEPALDLVRPGVASYGVLDESLPIAPDAADAAARLRPAMSLKARPIAFSRVPAGGTVGYGGTWTAHRPSRIAVLPVGYGDAQFRQEFA